MTFHLTFTLDIGIGSLSFHISFIHILVNVFTPLLSTQIDRYHFFCTATWLSVHNYWKFHCYLTTTIADGLLSSPGDHYIVSEKKRATTRKSMQINQMVEHVQVQDIQCSLVNITFKFSGFRLWYLLIFRFFSFIRNSMASCLKFVMQAAAVYICCNNLQVWFCVREFGYHKFDVTLFFLGQGKTVATCHATQYEPKRYNTTSLTGKKTPSMPHAPWEIEYFVFQDRDRRSGVTCIEYFIIQTHFIHYLFTVHWTVFSVHRAHVVL